MAAIILHSSIRDIDTVIVDGRIRKDNGKLAPVEIDPSLPGVTIPKQSVRWGDVAKELLSSRERVLGATAKADADDFDHQVPAAIKLFRVDPNRFV